MRLSKDEIQKEILMVTTDAQEPKMQPIESNYLENGVTDPRAEGFRWNGVSVSKPKVPLSNAVLAAFGSEARRLGRALNDAERAEIIARHANV
jgi:hypothetical protein